MSRIPSNQPIMPSILDRLIDPDSGGTVAKPYYDVEQIMSVVRRDLEYLLNSRQTCSTRVLGYPEVAESIVAYGLPDLVNLAAVTTAQREAIARMLESIIARYEPRLKEIQATLAEDDLNGVRTLRYTIQARLKLDPAPDVAFDTVLELTTGKYSITPRES